ncbi:MULTISPECIES: bifunctional diguanylate cyclase/phosphodiesterase [unclassified Nitratiruptor]|uniref:putative bifunctional diguanylate cyclase/phosphodiesterase n=1 Tax=unclassified Nitratiruptor TaxID=2624044 RepID=UPI001916B20D|nr:MULTISPECIES: bifunctional diguanylate cyclase/phosphodiesterase [unclassified Nitratiruptor]BCD59641.1 diguanylate cyclase/phosphodiesterase [Nitratiruptor sp. YY08-10]BCD63565.1 diguanylate cyclase/phosphodiesterase [Nitratiruptor sp. YY08-14]
MKSYKYIYSFLIVTIILSIIYLFYAVSHANKHISINIEKTFTRQAQYFANNIEEVVKKRVPKNLYSTLRSHPKLRENLQDALSLLITPTFKYVYILYRDKHGKYRYLLDGSKEDRGEFDAPLNVDIENWNRVYDSGKDQIVLEKDLETLWGTYLKPLRYKGKTEAIIAIDFSTNLPFTISSVMEPIKNIFYYIFLSFFLLLLILLWQMLLNIKTRKEVFIDPLTQVYNRKFLREFINSRYQAQRYQILMLDIDHFKRINDIYGHKAGDYVLREVARLIKKSIREEDLLIRFGGEEFVLFIYRENRDSNIAKEIAERIRKVIEQEDFIYETHHIKVTVSIGINLHPEYFKSPTEAIKYTDELLYVAKRQGRNQVIDEKEHNQHNKAIEDININSVKEALDDNRIICYYQPIFDLKNNSIVKFEALARMIDQKGHIITPNQFLTPIAFTNVYNDLTKKIIEIVFQAIHTYNVHISINLNMSDILDNVIYSTIIEEIKQNKNLAKWLTIELLEYESGHIERLKERLKEIKSYGIQIAIDDFGSGYSNFSIFQHLPIDILKIDGELIKNIESSHISFAITKSIALFANDLQIMTVAEFIHNEKTLEIVKNLGIRYGQGFFLGKPEPLEVYMKQ